MHSPLASRFKAFARGFFTPLRSLKMILDHPKLLSLSLGPVIATIVVFSFLIYGALAGAWSFVHSTFLAAVSDYSGILFIVAALLVLSAVFFFASSLLTFLMGLISSPLNDFLAEHTERALGFPNVPGFSVGRVLRVFWIDFRKTIVSVFAGLVFGLGMLLPVANFVFITGLALLNTFTFITYPQSRREQGLRKSFQWIRQNLFASLGFGFATVILFSIPLVGFFALPLSVVGGTLLYADSVQNTDGTSSSL